MLTQGEAANLTDAALKLGYSPSSAYRWGDNDPEWREQIRQVEQIWADKLLIELNNPDLKMPYALALMFQVKKIRPEYRDSHKFEVESPQFQELLTELRRLGQAKTPEISSGDSTKPNLPLELPIKASEGE